MAKLVLVDLFSSEVLPWPRGQREATLLQEKLRRRERLLRCHFHLLWERSSSRFSAMQGLDLPHGGCDNWQADAPS
ncbi:hypothetical protein [Burkholderia multivorans]|uniref:hypothetical protein n=1 Tax=Burkholderia multivorans TaxID=87883 RepID=UPI001591F422|nr:hypothetical protein [Burkholderia multivorans]